MLSPIFQFRDRVTGELVAVFDINLLKGEVPYPFVVRWEQYKLVRAARPHVEGSGIADVRFSTKMTGLAQGPEHVDVTVINEGRETKAIPRPLRHRRRRQAQRVRPPGGNRVRGFHLARTLHQDRHQLRFRLDRPRLLYPRFFFPIPTNGSTCSRSKATVRPEIWRGIMPVPPDESDEQALSMEGIQRRLQGIHAKSGDYEIPYHALYSVHQRVAATFNKGRVLLAGDSASVDDPHRRHGHERRHP